MNWWGEEGGEESSQRDRIDTWWVRELNGLTLSGSLNGGASDGRRGDPEYMDRWKPLLSWGTGGGSETGAERDIFGAREKDGEERYGTVFWMWVGLRRGGETKVYRGTVSGCFLKTVWAAMFHVHRTFLAFCFHQQTIANDSAFCRLLPDCFYSHVFGVPSQR